VPQLKTIDHQFWIDHELAKVKDENRKAFLRQQFSGDEGIERFYEMMRSRKGAAEFTTGTWLAKLSKVATCGARCPPGFWGVPPRWLDAL
jgi:hypothetical protein